MNHRFNLLAGFLAAAVGLLHPTAARAGDPPPPADSAAGRLNQMWSRGLATGRGPVRLKTFPLRLEDISRIIPMGLTASGHVTPSDHLYLVAKDSAVKNKHGDVVAVADGFVVMVQWRPTPPGGQPDPTVFNREVDLKVFIEHSATCWSYLDHLTGIADFIRTALGDRLTPGPPAFTRLPVKAGQVIGQVGFQTFDFALVDTSFTRRGFVRPEQFLKRDPWKLHTVDPFDYVDEPLRSRLLALNPRTAEPRGGRMDYDQDGRLVGNWYREGTGGYAGLNQRIDYWVGHLAFVYDHIDPSRLVVSMGDYDGRPRQFWVQGNAPDPAQVSEKDGLVKYRLIWGKTGSAGQPTVRHDAGIVQGLALAQLQPGGRRLKFEVFPGRNATVAAGFTEAAQFYER